MYVCFHVVRVWQKIGVAVAPQHEILTCSGVGVKKIFWRSSSMASSLPASSISNVFVYGSLQADDVVRALLGRVPPSSPAVLPHHQRFSIKERVYPAIIPVEDKKVAGKVLQGITPPELRILDEFEDVEYERETVNVIIKDGSEKLEAYAYIWENKTDPNLYGEWDFEEWKVLHMEDFVKMTLGFMEEIELPDPKTRVAT